MAEIQKTVSCPGLLWEIETRARRLSEHLIKGPMQPTELCKSMAVIEHCLKTCEDANESEWKNALYGTKR